MRHYILWLLLLPLPLWGQTKKSEPLFEQAVEKSVVGQYEEAERLLLRALDEDPGYVEAWLLLGRQQLALERYDDALGSYRHALSLNPTSTRWRHEGEEGVRIASFRSHAVNNPVAFRPINLGENINSEDDEYLPALTADYRMLVFTRRSPRKATTLPGYPMEEDFFCSLYDTMELAWGPARRMPEPLNSNGNEGAQTLSHDGRVVLFAACNRHNEPTGCDLYMSVRHGGRWGKPRNLGAPVNSVWWESFPSLSIDGYTLYFASNRPGGYGGTDIWCCRLEEGRWSEPRNMGPSINTAGNETAPYIHFDDRTLYFASDGHVGMGGMDLFCARRVDDTTWGQPKNLGYPINTAGEENNLIVAPDGRTAIFSSDRYGGYGKQDLYSFVMPAPARPERITFLDPIRQAENLLTLGDTVTLPGIFFETAKATLLETSLAALDRLAEALLRHPSLRLEVGGHTDNVGSDEDNQLLSERRAKAVYEYLVARGVDATRLTYRGYGESRPVASNDNAEGRAKNRRTTLTPLRQER
ncbi:MAG: PD40 domain-containing protein [Bacteroidales bacterium]|nr:PD40 domain-containing protein [Bacteroidales bacterium]